MKISYVLPVYNAQNTIARCIQSLLDQEIKPYEIIVIDDASTDHTQRILDHYIDKLTLVINNREREGAAKCRNKGNALAKGSVIAVCDADVYYKSRSSAISQFFTENKDKSLFCSALHLRDATNPWQEWLQEAYDWDFKSKCPISHPTVAYRKKVIKKIKYKEITKDSDLYEFFLIDANKKKYKLGGCANPLMLKIEGNSNRNVEAARELKRQLYLKEGIKI